jgi:hypothetical protein
MNESPKGNCDCYAQKAYAYYRQHGLAGSFVCIWDWLLADSGRLTAFSTFFIFLATAVAAAVGFAQWRALHSTDEKIGRQLALMESDQRAWVPLKIALGEGLTYDVSGWQAAITYRITNVGKSPALNADVFAKLMPFIDDHWLPEMIKDGVPQGKPISGTNPFSEIDSACRFPESFKGGNWGRLLFPGEDSDGTHGLRTNAAQIEQAKIVSGGYHGQFLIVVCASYELSGDHSFHRTGQAFRLVKKTGTQMIDLNGETISKEDLALVPVTAGGSFAN